MKLASIIKHINPSRRQFLNRALQKKKLTVVSNEESYTKLLYKKELKKWSDNYWKIKNRKDEGEYQIWLDKLEKKYNYYNFYKKQLDNNNDIGIKFFQAKEDFMKEKNYLDLDIENKGVNIFNLKKELPLGNKIFKLNLIEGHKIESRRISAKLLKPHYFFTSKYNENSKPSQINHWTSSAYSFLKKEKAGNNFLDVFTTKLIKLFFSVKYIKRKKVWNLLILAGFKIVADYSLIRDINNIISYTSNRTSLAIKNLTSFPRSFFTVNWVGEQINISTTIGRMIKHRKLDILSGYYPKRKLYLRKLRRVLLSKPLFKHTSFNLIIDLFIYNNKNNRLRKLRNISVRRGLYKYMYSMYINYSQKIKESINRPRFFYLNLIEPKTYNYYNLVVNTYGKLLMKKNIPFFFLICLLMLQFNKFFKQKIYSPLVKHNIIEQKKIFNNINYNLDIDISSSIKDNSIIKKENNHIISFKRRLYKKNISPKTNIFSVKVIKNINLDNYNIQKNIVKKIKKDSDIDEKKKVKKSIKVKKSRYLIYKKYLEELERKSSTPLDINTLSLWSTEGLGKNYRTPLGKTEDPSLSKRTKRGYRKQRLSPSWYITKDLMKKGRLKKGYPKKLKRSIAYDVKKRAVKKAKREALNESKEQSRLEIKNNNNFIKDKNIYNNSNKLNNKFELFSNSNLSPSDNIDNINNIDNMDKNQIHLGYNENDQSKNSSIQKDSYLDDKKVNVKFQSLNKEEYIKEVFLKKKEDNIELNDLFTSFYFNKKDKKSYHMNVKKRNILISDLDNNLILNYNSKVAYKNSFLGENPYLSDNRDKACGNKQNYYYKSTNKYNNSKILWDNLDHSIMSVLSYFVQIDRSKTVSNSRLSQISSLYNEVKKFKGYGDIWYLMYFMSVAKKEFNNVYRDIIMLKEIDIIPDSPNIKNNTLSFGLDNNLEKDVLHYMHKKNKVDINLWPSFNDNKRVDNLGIKFGYNEKLFKPYYRYMIPYFIIKSYYNFMYTSGFGKSLYNIINDLIKKIDIIKSNKFIMFNFLSVKILLDLLRYNYRSLIRIKPKYYYISKLRFYEIKLRKLSINNWMASIRYIKKLRKTPKYFWLRYHWVASYYYSRVVRYAELDTKRKILVPFVIYFEDILFNIYGKWVILRLWPLKRYFLSSFILAGRVLTLLLWRRKRQQRRYTFQRVTRKLLSGFKALQIKKAYESYISNAIRWPDNLVNKMKDYKYLHQSNYSKLEFYEDDILRDHTLSSYGFVNSNLPYYIPNAKNNYLRDFNKNIKLIKKYYKKKQIRRFSINKSQFIYYWLKPLKHYIINLNRYFDISGIKFIYTGRPGIRRSNMRSLYKKKIYGNFLGPQHIVDILKKPITIATPRIRGYLKSNIDYAFKVSKGRNGAVSFKVWISSVISTDLHELLLHLVRIKDLYTQLMNRYYIIHRGFNYIKNNYLPKSINKSERKFRYSYKYKYKHKHKYKYKYKYKHKYKIQKENKK